MCVCACVCVEKINEFRFAHHSTLDDSESTWSGSCETSCMSLGVNVSAIRLRL